MIDVVVNAPSVESEKTMPELESFEVGDTTVVLRALPDSDHPLLELPSLPPIECVVVTTRMYRSPDHDGARFDRLIGGGSVYYFSTYSMFRHGLDVAEVRAAVPRQVYDEIIRTGTTPDRGYVLGERVSASLFGIIRTTMMPLVQGPVAAVKVKSRWIAPETDGVLWNILPDRLDGLGDLRIDDAEKAQAA